jgi:hypothetical protein
MLSQTAEARRTGKGSGAFSVRPAYNAVMDENPYKSPESPGGAPRRRKRRLPWLLIGTLGGVLTMALLLPMVSDSRGVNQVNVIVGCLGIGFFVGLLMDLFGTA